MTETRKCKFLAVVKRFEGGNEDVRLKMTETRKCKFLAVVKKFEGKNEDVRPKMTETRKCRFLAVVKHIPTYSRLLKRSPVTTLPYDRI